GVQFTLRLPVFWAAMVGIGLQAASGGFPVPIERGITILGQGAIPLALLTLGIQLARTPLVFGRHELLGAGLRLVVSPLLAYGLASGLGLQGLDRQVVVLQAAMPVAVNSLIWVTELGGDRTRVARTIVLSTFLSLFTLPVVLWLSSQ
ncbi:AEC family transporter, partial [Nodosilinea sp. LEGE 07088]|uniref:AEC family transporter n=1 Tax=Nodosilinea sp. LEGE 07088 TaxID=2777968 RepID=UPI00187EBCB5